MENRDCAGKQNDLKEQRLRFRACGDPAFPFLPGFLFFWRIEGAKVFPVPPRALGNPWKLLEPVPEGLECPGLGTEGPGPPRSSFQLPRPHSILQAGFIGPGSPGDEGFCEESYPKPFLQLLRGQKKNKKK